MHGIPDDVMRWTAKRRQALILQLVRGETTPAQMDGWAYLSAHSRQV
jgi:hypothetical protein